jgi:hypothetical protein
MMATLHWMHSNRVAYEGLVEFLCMGLEIQMNSVTAERDSGMLPVDQITDVLYSDLMADPFGTVARLYEAWEIELSQDAASRLQNYIDARHAQRGGGGHDYRFEDTGLVLAEHRALVADYQKRFGVRSEV